MAFAGAVALAACAPAEPAPEESGDAAAASSEISAVVAAVETVMRAINTADSDLARSVVLPDARFVRVSAEGRSNISGETFAAGIGDPEQGFVERIWDPVVRLQGPVATVWAPYDFYLHGEFSHCGVDTVQLVREGEAWKVQSLVYSVLQPPACEMHPEGPPPV